MWCRSWSRTRVFAVPRPYNILQAALTDGGATIITFATQLCSPSLAHLWQMQVCFLRKHVCADNVTHMASGQPRSLHHNLVSSVHTCNCCDGVPSGL